MCDSRSPQYAYLEFVLLEDENPRAFIRLQTRLQFVVQPNLHLIPGGTRFFLPQFLFLFYLNKRLHRENIIVLLFSYKLSS